MRKQFGRHGWFFGIVTDVWLKPSGKAWAHVRYVHLFQCSHPISSWRLHSTTHTHTSPLPCHDPPRYTDGDEEDIPLKDLPQFLAKPLPPLPESELQRPKGDGKGKEKKAELAAKATKVGSL